MSTPTNQIRVQVFADVAHATANVAQFEQNIVQTENRIQRMSAAGADAGREIAGGLGVPLTASAGLLTAIGLVTVGLHKAMEAGREDTLVNHVLAASAIEAGLGFADATEKAERFASQTGQSVTEATKQYSELLRVAGAVGQSGGLDKVQQNLADLAVAHGTSASEVLQSVITGREAGLRAVGIFDINKQYADYAKTLHITTAELSDAEQMQVRYNAAAEKGGQFAGSAAQFLGTAAGQMQTLDATLDNMTSDLGLAILANKEFREALGGINDLIKLIGVSATTTAVALKTMTPAEIARQSGNAPGALTLDALKAAYTTPLDSAVTAIRAATGRLGKEDFNSLPGLGFIQNALKAYSDRFDVTKKTIEAEKELGEKADANAVQQQAQIKESFALANRMRESQAASDATVKGIQLGIAHTDDVNEQIKGMQKLRAEIESHGESVTVTAAEVANKIATVDEQIFQAQKKAHDSIIATYKDTGSFLDEMLQRVNKDNPFVVLTAQADTVLERTRKRFGAFGEDFVQQMAKVESKAIDMERLAARIASAQKVLDIEAEITKLKFGATGTSAEDQRRLGVYGKQITAATDVPGLEAKARAIETGKLQNQNDILFKQVDNLRQLANEQIGSGYGNREAQAKFNEQLIALWEGASPAQQQALLRRSGFREDVAGAYRGQAEQKQQDIEDEKRRADASRLTIQAAEKSFAALDQFKGTPGEEEARKVFLARSGALSESELTPALRVKRADALAIEAKKEAEKEKKAEADRQKLFGDKDGNGGLINIILKAMAGQGIKVLPTSALVNVEVKNDADKTTVTGPAFEAGERNTMQGL